MAQARPFTETMLVIGILKSIEALDLDQCLESAFGPIESKAGPFEFTFTDYYDQEMGCRPQRLFYSFASLVDPSDLAGIKIQTNQLEQRWAVDGERKVNLDPGILSLSSFILATTKDRSHRIPLSRGIYGETTLIYQDKRFNPLAWTYADYRSEQFCELFRTFRETYKCLLNK